MTELHHIGIISNTNDLEKLWIDILGFKKDYDFIIPSGISDELFEVKAQIPVQVIRKEELMIELFLIESINSAVPNINHLCLLSDNPQKIAELSKESGFKVIIPKQGHPVFIKDNSGNMFEIKQRQ